MDMCPLFVCVVGLELRESTYITYARPYDREVFFLLGTCWDWHEIKEMTRQETSIPFCPSARSRSVTSCGTNLSVCFPAVSNVSVTAALLTLRPWGQGIEPCVGSWPDSACSSETVADDSYCCLLPAGKRGQKRQGC